MGILRSDRVSGLGGANAINGSVFFGGDLGSNGNYLAVGDSDDFNFGSGDFTIECWVYADALSTNNFEGIIGQWPQNGANALNSWVLEVVGRDLEFYYCYNGANIGSVVQGATMIPKQWNHVMVTRSGNTMYMFHNGGLTGSGTSVTATFNDVSADVTIGGNINSAAMWNGNISNLRIIKGRALYTTAGFTPPSTRLTKTSDTVLLCCQSPGDVTQEETGKIITPKKSNSNSSFPVASRRSPDKYDGIPISFASNASPLGTGEDHGTTFADNTKFDTLSYMVPPGGTTAESNRGRGIFSGGYATPSYKTTIDYIQIQSTGNASDFGDLSATGLGEGADCSSSTRAIQGGGSLINNMEYVTIATTSNTTDFGDLTVARRSLNSLSSNTRGIWAGGTTNPAMSDVIDYATIATTGDATDFGNLTVGRRNMGTAASPTRGVFAGGNPGSSPLCDDTIDYITIATTGDATDFGNLSAAYREMDGCSNGTRGLFVGGGPGSGVLNTIDFVTISSTGNGTDFGDLFVAAGNIGGTSNGIRGVFAGGAYFNTIQYVTISTTGNAADFGDLTLSRILYSATSDSHGGIS